MAEETREDPGGTVDATTEAEDMVAGKKETGATEPASTATEIRTTTEPAKTAQMTETPKADGTPGDRLGIGKWQGYSRGYARGPNYSDQDVRGSRYSRVEPGGQMNGALEHDGRLSL